MQEFIRITEGYTYPAEGGGLINEVTYVENQDKPSLLQYVQSIPGVLLNGTTSLPKPVGADTKVRACIQIALRLRYQAAIKCDMHLPGHPCHACPRSVSYVPYAWKGALLLACHGLS